MLPSIVKFKAIGKYDDKVDLEFNTISQYPLHLGIFKRSCVAFPTLPLSTFKQEHFAQWRTKIGHKSGLKGSGDSEGRIECTGDALAIAIHSQLPTGGT